MSYLVAIVTWSIHTPLLIVDFHMNIMEVILRYSNILGCIGFYIVLPLGGYQHLE